MARTSVPCACGAEVFYGASSCTSCGETLPRELKLALEERFEASSEEYRIAKAQVFRASFATGILAVSYLGAGALLGGELGGASTTVLGGVLLVLALVASRAPVPTLVLAIFLGTGTYALSAVLDPAAFFARFASFGGFASLFGRLALLILQVGGVRGGVMLGKIRKGEVVA